MPRRENVSHHPSVVGAQRQGFQPKDNLEIAVNDFPPSIHGIVWDITLEKIFKMGMGRGGTACL